MRSTTEHREIEIKFRIPADLIINIGDILASTHHVGEPLDHRSMDATYYDTASLSLIKHERPNWCDLKLPKYGHEKKMCEQIIYTHIVMINNIE